MKSSYFCSWLRRQQHLDDPIGDLAQDVARDPNFSEHCDSLDDARSYLKQRGASRVVIQTLESAWRSWEVGQ